MGKVPCPDCVACMCLVHSEVEWYQAMKAEGRNSHRKKRRSNGESGSRSRESQQAAQPAA